jgi:FKBP-type peptidyl-prolyl cis-trans isomerase FklB
MKKILSGVSLLTILSLTATAQVKHKKTVKSKAPTVTPVAKPAALLLKNSDDSFAYSIGLNLAYDLKQRNVTQINADLLKKGIEDAMKENAQLTPQQVNMTIQQRLKQAMDSKLNAEKDKGAAFLAANGKRAGVVTLPSGVEYEILTKSDSTVSPTEKDTVVANYVGSLMDGTEFDNSFKRNQPITISVTGVIKGWTEILQKMHVGDKYKVYIPSDMAYGDRGAGNGAIPGGATLVFEIDLLEIHSPATATK